MRRIFFTGLSIGAGAESLYVALLNKVPQHEWLSAIICFAIAALIFFSRER